MKRWRRDRFPRWANFSLAYWILNLSLLRRMMRKKRARYGAHRKSRSMQIKRALEMERKHETQRGKSQG